MKRATTSRQERLCGGFGAAWKVLLFEPAQRFGKSLFLDTLKEMFEGNQALFTGLAAETRWDWSKKYPVIRIGFGEGVLRSSAELDLRIREILQDKAQRLGAMFTHESIGGRF